MNRETPLSADDFRTLGALVLLVCYERKAKREFVIKVIETVSDIHTCVERVGTAIAFTHLLEQVEAGRKSAAVADIIQEWGNKLTELRRTLAGYMELLVECPSSTDMIS